MNYLGIDYGKKRMGLSICHSDVRIALPMDAIVSDSDAEKIEKICLAVEKNKIGEIAIGYPINMDGSMGSKAREVDAFIGKLSSKLPCDVKINRVDERLTSEQAGNEAKSSRGGQSPGKKRRQRRRGIIDSLAATIILRDFLDGVADGRNH
ncbi:MAG: Holliday junction resolvase RuvX [Puniceicoccales bacterium]|nr:Holliday junction resolvase RuvX [Puniceicoccales bacterium]